MRKGLLSIHLMIAFLSVAAALSVTAAQAQPSLSKGFNSTTIGPGNISTITFTITNGSASPVTGLAFTDTLPVSPGPMTVADPANVSTTCDLGPSGSISAPDGGAAITLSDARIGGSQSCTIRVNVTASTPGIHTNPAVTLSSSAGSSMSLPVDLTVTTSLPGFSKSFSPSSVPLGDKSTLTFLIDNTANASRIGSLDFTDNLPAGMVIADPANASTDCEQASSPNTTLTAVPGSNTVILDANGLNFSDTSATLLAGATCSVNVDVRSIGTGMLDNISNDLLADFSAGGKAADTLEVTSTTLALQKSFTDDPVAPGGNATLRFIINNFDRDFAATNVAFTDDLTSLVPSLVGLTFDSVVSNSCGGSVAGAGGGTSIDFTGGTVAAQSSCTLIVSLAVPAATSPDSYRNTTGTISGELDGSPTVGNMASDTLVVAPTVLLTKEFLDDPVNPGGSVELSFTATNTSSTSSATDIAFEDVFDIVLPTASVTPVSDCCGDGSTCTFIPLTNPPPPSDVSKARLTISEGLLSPAGMVGDSCTFSITLDVASGAAPGLYPNVTSNVTATIDGGLRSGSPASDTLQVISAPRLSKAFTDDPVPPGGTATLQFTLSSPPDASADATAITFTDDLQAALSGLTANLPSSPDPPCGPGSTLTGSAGDSLLTLMGGSLMPGEDCVFNVTVNVPAAASPGSYTNTTSGVSAMVEGFLATSAPASDDLEISGLSFSKQFLDDPVIPGADVTLRYTLENTHPTDDATDVELTDNLADVLPGTPDLVAMLPPLSDTCGGTLSGPTSLSYSGGSLLSGQTCTIEVLVSVPVAADDGSYISVSGPLGATQGGSPVTADPAVDFLDIDSSLLQLTKTFTDDPVAPGGSVTLEFALSNLDAGSAASDIDFSDNLDAALSGLLFDSLLVNTCGATVTGTGTGLITVTGGALAASGSCVIRTSLTVPAAATASLYTNTTSAVSGLIDGLSVSGSAASDVLEVVPLLQLSKSFDGPTTATGTAMLTFTITNPGAEAVDELEFSDNLDDVIPGLVATDLPSTPCGAESSITGTSFLAFTGGSLPPMGGMCSFDVEVQVPVSATSGTYLNVTSDLQQNGLTLSDPATANLVIEPPPTFAKVFSPDTILAGGISTLTFTINNSASTLAATGLAFTDNLPANVVVATPSNASSTCGGTLTAMPGNPSISLSGGSVGAGATCTLAVDVTSIVSGPHVNTTGELTSSSGNSGTASDTLTVNSAADVSVSKSDGVTAATPGSSLTYTIVVANAGPSTDPAVALSDTLPAVLTCTYTSAAAGGATGNTAAGAGDLAETLAMPASSSVTYTVSCTIDSDATGTLSNTASITPSITDLMPGNNSATDDDTVLVPSADLAITKTDGVTSAVPGQTTLTYTLVASNAGPSDDPSASVSDTFPSDLTCTYTSVAAGGATGNTAAGAGDLADTLDMPAGSSVTYTASCTIDDAAAGTLSNTATITASVDDPDSGNNSATDDDTELMPSADLAITKSDGVTSAVPGQTTLTYTIVASNAGPSVDPSASVDDAFPAGLTCTYTSVAAGGATGNTAAGAGDLADTLAMPVGSSVTYTASCEIADDTTGTLSNTATITASVDDPDTGNNSATDDDTVLIPETDLSILKEGSPDPVAAGGELTYTLTVTNHGPSASSGSTLTDVLPAGVTFTSSSDCSEAAGTVTCTLGAISAGANQLASFVVTVDDGPATVITNTASISANETDGTPGNDSSTVMTTVNPQPGFDKAFDPDSIIAGETTVLTFTIDNSKSTAATTALDFTDDLPDAIEVADPANASTTCTGGTLTATAGAGVITYTGGSVGAGGTCTISVDITSGEAGVHENISGDLTSSLGNSGPASATLEVTDAGAPEVTAVASTDGPLAACDTVRRRLTSIRVTVEDDLTPVLNADDLDSYLLVGAGPDGDFSTTSCAGGVSGDDVQVVPVGVSQTGSDPLVANVALALPPTEGLYRFLVCDTITDSAGNALDGDGDNMPGGDFVIAFFRADPLNLFANGHFDDCPVSLDPWATVAMPPNAILPGTPGVDDVEASPLSASAQVSHSTDAASTLGQCVPVVGGLAYDFEASLRFNPPMGAVASFSRTCELFAGPMCSGANLGSDSSFSIIEDEGGAWVTSVESIVVPAGAVSALCDLGIAPVGDDPNFDVFLDAIFMGTEGGTFRDGFESGDTSAWSSTSP